MHAASPFLESLAMVLCVAAATTVICQRLHLPVVLGYLLAGVLIGPHAPALLVADAQIIRTLSELGVILLMFSIGMELSLRKLGEVGPRGAVVVIVEIALMLTVGYFVASLAGFSPLECAFLAAMLAISSTTIIVRAFEEHPQAVPIRVREQLFGVMVIEDVVAILLIALLTTLATTRSFDLWGLAESAGRLGVFLSVLMLVGLVVVPRLIRFVVALKRPETTLVTTVGICFAAALAAQRFEYSVALGAFLAGTLVAESGEGRRIAPQLRPLRDIFTAVFFVSIGLSINPAEVYAQAGWILLFAAVVILGKFVGVGLGAFAVGHPVRSSAQFGLAMGQIGEFSFIIAGMGVAFGVIDPSLLAIAVGVACMTILLTPTQVKYSARFGAWIDSRLPQAMQTFATLYGTWVERLGKARRAGTAGARIRRYARLLALDAVLLLAVLIAAAAGGDEVAHFLKSRLPDAAEVMGWLVAGGFLMLAAPLALGLYRLIRALGQALAVAALPEAGEGEVDFANAPRRVFVVILQLGITLLVLLPMMAILQPFVPAIKGGAPLLALVIVAGIAFWRNATQLQGHVRAGAQALVAAVAVPGASTAEQAEMLDQMEQVLPGLGDFAPYALDARNHWVGRSLAEVNLRGATGATVLAIRRGEEAVLTPTGHDTLAAGDVLVLTGTSEAIEAARELLGRR